MFYTPIKHRFFDQSERAQVSTNVTNQNQNAKENKVN